MRTSKVFALSAAYIEHIHDDGIAINWPGTEPVATFDCLDLNLLESAAEQPFQAGFGVDFYPTIYDKAACLFFSIAGGHIFSNGNKRTAVMALDLFLYANAQYLVLSNDEIGELAEQTASYRTRNEDQAEVKKQISNLVEENSFPFSVARVGEPKLYRRLHRIKNMLRNSPLNQPSSRPRQAIVTRGLPH